MSGSDAGGGTQATTSSNRDWDAATYDQISAPQQRWADEQFERLKPLRGDELMLDAGCGSGKVTARLVEMVPDGHVYAVDVAPSMVRHTQEALGDKVTASCQDLTELSLPESVDVVFSNATFHWIGDHQKLFNSIFAVLKPGGRLVAQCGGYGNIDAFRVTADEVAREDPRFTAYFGDWQGPWNYAKPEETRERLERAGFVDVETWLEERPTTLSEAAPFVRTVCLVRHLDRLPPELHEPFVEAVLSRFPSPLVLDYVRLNMIARVP